MPQHTQSSGWLVNQAGEPGFVEPSLRVIQGDPFAAKAIVVAAPGAVGKSAFAKSLCSATSSVLVDLARTGPLGDNFFVGGVANAFGVQALTDASEGRLGLVIDALDEAQLRSSAEGFAAGLTDLVQILSHERALPATLFGRSAAAEEAWLVLTEAGLDPCLLEIDFFDEARALRYIEGKLPLVAARRPESGAAYSRHPENFRGLAIATRTKLVDTPGGSDPRFAGYAPVLDAVCSFAVEDESLNPQARIAQLSAEGPVALVAEIASAILEREQGKVVKQLGEEVALEGIDLSSLYSPNEQLGRLASVLLGSPAPHGPEFPKQELRRAYDRMVGNFAPQHPFLDGRGGPSNAAFASYLLVWTLTSSGTPEAARKALVARPSLRSGLLFDLYMLCLEGEVEGLTCGTKHHLSMADVGPLFAAFSSQVGQGQQASLDVTAEGGDVTAGVAFDLETSEEADDRHYGPFEAR